MRGAAGSALGDNLGGTRREPPAVPLASPPLPFRSPIFPFKSFPTLYRRTAAGLSVSGAVLGLFVPFTGPKSDHGRIKKGPTSFDAGLIYPFFLLDISFCPFGYLSLPLLKNDKRQNEISKKALKCLFAEAEKSASSATKSHNTSRIGRDTGPNRQFSRAVSAVLAGSGGGRAGDASPRGARGRAPPPPTPTGARGAHTRPPTQTPRGGGC